MTEIETMTATAPAGGRVVIGIDPDTDRNGVAEIRTPGKEMEVASLTFPETLEHVKRRHREWTEGGGSPASIRVLVEAGWLNRSNWHVKGGKGAAWAAAVGRSDGECSAVSKKLLECLEYYGIRAEPVRPLRKCWSGRDRKITHVELLRELEIYGVRHSLKGRSNQEERDAALIALVNM